MLKIVEYRDKLYVFLGEFEHAPGHCLLCEFGNNWKISGMHHISELEFLSSEDERL